MRLLFGLFANVRRIDSRKLTMNAQFEVEPITLPDWFVIATLPRKEILACDQLRNQGIDVFLPTRRKTVHHARRAKTIFAPLFPNYLFASMEAGPAVIRSINGTRGVNYILTSGEVPTPLPAGFVESLAANLNQDGTINFIPNLKPGDRIEFACGPFARQIGELLALDERGRVSVLLEMLGSHIPVKASVTDILPA